MKVCPCGSQKWKTIWPKGGGKPTVQCLKCYEVYPSGKFIRLKDKP